MMNLDLNKLSFKIPEPAGVKHKDNPFFNENKSKKAYFDNAIETTSNPYRHSKYLFKELHREEFWEPQKESSKLHHIKKQIQESNIILENFDSFQDVNFFVDSKENMEKCRIDEKNYKLAEIQSVRTYKQEKHSRSKTFKTEQFDHSVIEDDFNAELCFTINTDKQKSGRKIKTDNEIFFLTTQEKESQSSIRQFYFNLNQHEGKDLNTLNQTLRQEPRKMELKKMIYAFIDELENLPQNQINHAFIRQLNQFLNKNIQENKKGKQNCRGKTPETLKKQYKRNSARINHKNNKQKKKLKWI